jgi:hypothetical protein
MLGLKALLVDVISESITKGLVAFLHEINAKHTAEREEVTDEDMARADRFRTAVGKLQQPQGDSRPSDSSPALPPL